MKTELLGLVLAGAVGCAAHTTMRGSVVMKVSETEAHVCLGKGEVTVGKMIHIYRNLCDQQRAPESADGAIPPIPCRRESSGDGQVIRVLNDHYSVVRFPTGVPFKEGDTVEADAR